MKKKACLVLMVASLIGFSACGNQVNEKQGDLGDIPIQTEAAIQEETEELTAEALTIQENTSIADTPIADPIAFKVDACLNDSLLDYKNIMRNMNSFVGEKVSVSGVIEALGRDSGGVSGIISCMDNFDYEVISFSSKKDLSIMEGDYVTFYGLIDGQGQYTETLSNGTVKTRQTFAIDVKLVDFRGYITGLSKEQKTLFFGNYMAPVQTFAGWSGPELEDYPDTQAGFNQYIADFEAHTSSAEVSKIRTVSVSDTKVCGIPIKVYNYYCGIDGSITMEFQFNNSPLWAEFYKDRAENNFNGRLYDIITFHYDGTADIQLSPLWELVEDEYGRVDQIPPEDPYKRDMTIWLDVKKCCKDVVG